MTAHGDSTKGWAKSSLRPLAALLLALAVLLPRLTGELTYPLHDVGFNLEVLTALDRTEGLGDYLECAATHRPQRFYPAYWAGQHLLWRLGGRSLDLFMPANLLLLALLIWGVGSLARILGGNPYGAMVLLLFSPGLIENTHTIMKQELALAVAQVLLLRTLLGIVIIQRRTSSRTRLAAGTVIGALLILFAGTLKETGAVAGIAILLWLTWSRARGDREGGCDRTAALVGLGLLSLGLGVLAFLSRKTGAYTQAASLAPAGILGVIRAYAGALWPWLLHLPGVLWLTLAAWRPSRAPGPLGLAALFCLGWGGAYMLWTTTQIRYFLPAFALLAALIPVAWAHSRPWRRPAGWGAPLLAAGLLVTVLVYALPRAVRESRARATADTALAITRVWLATRDQGARVLVCLPEDEPLQELRGQLAWEMGRPDLRLEPALIGKSPVEWARGIADLTASPPRGVALLIPFAKGLPAYADRVFPVTDQLSPLLEKGIPHVLGEKITLERSLAAKDGAMEAGFRIYRFGK